MKLYFFQIYIKYTFKKTTIYTQNYHLLKLFLLFRVNSRGQFGQQSGALACVILKYFTRVNFLNFLTKLNLFLKPKIK